MSKCFADLYETYLVRQLFRIAHNDLNDKKWTEAFGEMYRSQFAFMLADLRADDDLIERAGDMIVYGEGRFAAVLQLVEACAAHEWNGTIYEAWVWETAQRVHTLMRRLDPASARALQLYASHLDYFEIDTGSMQEAIYEARLARGELE